MCSTIGSAVVMPVGGYLPQSDAKRILSDVEDFARRNPWPIAPAGDFVVQPSDGPLLRATAGALTGAGTGLR